MTMKKLKDHEKNIITGGFTQVKKKEVLDILREAVFDRVMPMIESEAGEEETTADILDELQPLIPAELHRRVSDQFSYVKTRYAEQGFRAGMQIMEVLK